MKAKWSLGLSLLLFISLSSSIRAFKEGDPCAIDGVANDTLCGPTDPPNYLKCHTTELVCRCTEIASYFDPRDERCHKYVDQSCLATTMPCPINGNCFLNENIQRLCVCDDTYNVTQSKKCFRPLNEECTVGSDCEEGNYIFCQASGQCGCNDDSIYVASIDQCHIKVEELCGTSSINTLPAQPCSEFTECLEDLNQGPGTKCYCDPSASLVSVNAGASEGGGKMCVSTFGGSCDPAERPRCHEENFLRCNIDHRCVCPSFSQIDATKTICFLDEGRDCSQEVGSQPCNTEKFFICGTDGKCGCKIEDGAVLDPVQEICVLNSGSVCSNETGSQLCNPGKFLQCLEEKCQCEDNAVLDPQSDICSLNYEAACKLNGQPCDPAKFLQCNSAGICNCAVNGRWDDVDEICYLKHDAPCRAEPGNQKCDASVLLSCAPETGRCACTNTNTVYDAGRERCVVLVGGVCRTEDDCIQNSGCEAGVCTCKDTFHQTETGKCVRNFGEACVTGGGDYCDPDANLACDSYTDVCSCRDSIFMEFVPEDRFCYMKLNGQCGTDVDGGVPCKPPLLTCDPNTRKCICDPALGYTGDNGQECLKGFGSFCNETGGSVNDSCAFTAHSICLPMNECGCSQDYTAVVGNLPRCAGGLNVACQDDLDCLSSKSLGCVESTKKCGCYENQVYNGEDGYCYSLLGGPCNLTITSDPDPIQLCEKGLTCREIDSNRRKTGLCGAGGRIGFEGRVGIFVSLTFIILIGFH